METEKHVLRYAVHYNKKMIKKTVPFTIKNKHTQQINTIL